MRCYDVYGGENQIFSVTSTINPFIIVPDLTFLIWKQKMKYTTTLLSFLATKALGFAPPGHNVNKLQNQYTLRAGKQQQQALFASVDESEYDLSLFSPCKINLFLRIIQKRPDGFHDLASLFQTIGFGDMLHLKLQDESSESDTFECNMEGVPTDKSNLVIRALDLVRTKTGNEDKFFKANLVKQVPAQAGLGGGSGNAAAAMWGANELLGKPANLEQLVEWSGDLGSDITFFLSEGTAYCTGRGEIMTPVDPLPDGTKVCIVKPDIGLSTPEVFRALDYDQLSTIDPEELLDTFMSKGAIDAGTAAYVNDLEQPAFDCLPELKRLKDELKQVEGFDHVMMSGSGTSIFCIGEPTNQEDFMKEFDERKGINVFPAEFTSRKEGQWFENKM